jgi:hypothetical protein
MAIVIRERPAGEEELFDQLELAVGDPQADASAIAHDAGVEKVDLEAAEPLPVYTASMEDLQSDESLENAPLTAWHYVVFRKDDGAPFAIAEAASLRSDDKLQFTAQYPRGTAQALIDAVAHAAGRAGDQEFYLRLLRVPDFFIDAIWLYSSNPVEDDRLIAVSGPSSLKELGILNRRDFAAAVKALADSLESDDGSDDDSDDEAFLPDVSGSVDDAKEEKG